MSKATSTLLWVLLFLSSPVSRGPLEVAAQRRENAESRSIDEVAASEIRGLRSGLVLALYHGGQVNTMKAFGKTGPGTEVALTPYHLFPFPALTEVLVGATVQALADAGVLDLDAPVSAAFPLISPRLGAVRLGQLLTHTAGLDDAVLLEGEEWSEVMDRLNDRFLFTDPGCVYSRSRYSFPLLVKVVEKALGLPFREIADQAILGPLGMTRSTFDLERAKEMGLVTGVRLNDDVSSPFRSVEPVADLDGLPVLFTSAPDVIQFLALWMEGGIRGAPPWTELFPEDVGALPGDVGFRSGVRVDTYAGHLRVSRAGGGLGVGAGFQFFPAGNTALFTWGIGGQPQQTSRVSLERITAVLGPGSLPESESPQEADSSEATIPHHEKGWAGMYLNGEYKVELRSLAEGLVYFTGEQELAVVVGQGGDMAATNEEGVAMVRFRVEVDRNQRRYVRQGEKAFLHTHDAPGLRSRTN